MRTSFRVLAATAAAASIGFMAFAAAPASAVTPICGETFSCTVYYYNNAAHTTVVGYRITACGGQVTTWGKTSDYLSLQTEACPPGGE